MDVEAYGVHVSSGGRNDCQEIHNETLKESLHKKLNGLPPPFSYDRCCIYRVPNKLRRVNEEAYRPRLVSIGPLHHGSPHLQAMELYKVRCLKSYLKKVAGKLDEFENITTWAEKTEIYVRMCYQETIQLSRKQLAEMLLLDGVFIVELFLNNRFPGLKEVRDEIDLILGTKWMTCDLLHDLMLLENQLPLRVASELFDNIQGSLPVSANFIELAREFFKYVDNPNNIGTCIQKQPKHLLDYLLCVHLNYDPHRGDEYNAYTYIMPKYPSTITVLQEAGVKFYKLCGSFLLDISFKDGTLSIPRITVNEWTETLFRNLIAYEQCDHRPGYVTSYIIFMDSLIDTPKDVDTLVKCDIIENSLGDSEKVSDLFNNLHKDLVTEDSYFIYSRISKELNDYNKDYWHQWKAAWFKWKLILRRDYFSNPWSIISLIAAVVLLVLTVVQTVCSVLQV